MDLDHRFRSADHKDHKDIHFSTRKRSPSVLWYCWLGLLTCKNRLLYNLYCVGGDVKHCSLTHSLRESGDITSLLARTSMIFINDCHFPTSLLASTVHTSPLPPLLPNSVLFLTTQTLLMCNCYISVVLRSERKVIWTTMSCCSSWLVEWAYRTPCRTPRISHGCLTEVGMKYVACRPCPASRDFRTYNVVYAATKLHFGAKKIIPNFLTITSTLQYTGPNLIEIDMQCLG